MKRPHLLRQIERKRVIVIETAEVCDIKNINCNIKIISC